MRFSLLIPKQKSLPDPERKQAEFPNEESLGEDFPVIHLSVFKYPDILQGNIQRP